MIKTNNIVGEALARGVPSRFVVSMSHIYIEYVVCTYTQILNSCFPATQRENLKSDMYEDGAIRLY